MCSLPEMSTTAWPGPPVKLSLPLTSGLLPRGVFFPTVLSQCLINALRDFLQTLQQHWLWLRDKIITFSECTGQRPWPFPPTYHSCECDISPSGGQNVSRRCLKWTSLFLLNGNLNFELKLSAFSFSPSNLWLEFGMSWLDSGSQRWLQRDIPGHLPSSESFVCCFLHRVGGFSLAFLLASWKDNGNLTLLHGRDLVRLHGELFQSGAAAPYAKEINMAPLHARAFNRLLLHRRETGDGIIYRPLVSLTSDLLRDEINVIYKTISHMAGCCCNR